MAADLVWRGNPHWMRRAGEEPPDHDPVNGCESCGWVEDDGVEASDLLWAPSSAWSPDRGQWLCLECD